MSKVFRNGRWEVDGAACDPPPLPPLPEQIAAPAAPTNTKGAPVDRASWDANIFRRKART